MHTGNRWPGKVRKAFLKSDRLTTQLIIKSDSELYCPQQVKPTAVRRADKELVADSKVRQTQTCRDCCFCRHLQTRCKTLLRVAARPRATSSVYIRTAASSHHRVSDPPTTKCKQALQMARQI